MRGKGNEGGEERGETGGRMGGSQREERGGVGEGGWLRIAKGPVRAELPAEAWVLCDAQDLGLGMLLKRVSPCS